MFNYILSKQSLCDTPLIHRFLPLKRLIVSMSAPASIICWMIWACPSFAATSSPSEGKGFSRGGPGS